MIKRILALLAFTAVFAAAATAQTKDAPKKSSLPKGEDIGMILSIDGAHHTFSIRETETQKVHVFKNVPVDVPIFMGDKPVPLTLLRASMRVHTFAEKGKLVKIVVNLSPT
jgi:hypothetical protein